MMRTQIAYVQAKWHSNIVSKSLDGFRAALPDADVVSFEVPGAFEMPLIAKSAPYASAPGDEPVRPPWVASSRGRWSGLVRERKK